MTTARSRFRILVVDDEPEIVRDLVDLLEDEGYAAEGVSSGQLALAKLIEQKFDLLVSDLRMPPPDGIALLETLRTEGSEVPVILLTAHADPDLARRAIEAGAFDYVTKPWNTFELLLRVRRVRERWDVSAQQARMRRYLEHLTGEQEVVFQDLVAKSPGMQSVFELARRVAPSEATVLLRGESGTGKSALAQAIHGLSPRRAGPFVKVNCGAIPETLLESELFGHERGAFTGAIKQKLGLFEIAEHGTLFLDEIGDISLPVQVKLLQAIEEKAFHRVGGTDRLTCDVRLIAATHRDLEEAIRDGEFREDLFYRLNVFPLALPALRDRREDIPLLVEHFLRQRGLGMEKLAPEVLLALTSYDFPGNIRELQNVLERGLILAGPGRFEMASLPALRGVQVTMEQPLPDIPDHGLSLEEEERRYILAALQKAGGNKTKAAALLGMTRRTLYSRMERHGIPV